MYFFFSFLAWLTAGLICLVSRESVHRSVRWHLMKSDHKRLFRCVTVYLSECVISLVRNYVLFVYAMYLSVPRSSLVCLPGAAVWERNADSSLHHETQERTEVYFIAGILGQILKITKQLRRWILNSFYTVCWYYMYYTLLYIDFISSLGLCCSLILVVYYLIRFLLE